MKKPSLTRIENTGSNGGNGGTHLAGTAYFSNGKAYRFVMYEGKVTMVGPARPDGTWRTSAVTRISSGIAKHYYIAAIEESAPSYLPAALEAWRKREDAYYEARNADLEAHKRSEALKTASPDLLAVAKHIAAMAGDVYLAGHPEWNAVLAEAEDAITKATP